MVCASGWPTAKGNVASTIAPPRAEDDQNFFPVYNLAMTIREDACSDHSDAYDELFGAITELLDNDTMRDLNARVDLEGIEPEQVARDFLVENGIISE